MSGRYRNAPRCPIPADMPGRARGRTRTLMSSLGGVLLCLGPYLLEMPGLRIHHHRPPPGGVGQLSWTCSSGGLHILIGIPTRRLSRAPPTYGHMTKVPSGFQDKQMARFPRL